MSGSSSTCSATLPTLKNSFQTSSTDSAQSTRRFTNWWSSRGFSLKLSTGAMFLDVSKAFNKVLHVGLLHKLIEGGILLSMCKLLDSYLPNRNFRVRTEGELSRNRSRPVCRRAPSWGRFSSHAIRQTFLSRRSEGANRTLRQGSETRYLGLILDQKHIEHVKA